MSWLTAAVGTARRLARRGRPEGRCPAAGSAPATGYDPPVRRPRQRPALALVAALLLAAPAVADPTLEPGPGDEALVYEWRLEGFKGVLLRLVAPGRGEGQLITVLTPEGHLRTELHISAERRRSGEFWLYGSEVDPTEHRSVKAWTAQQIGQEAKSRQADLEDADVIDVASGILLIRRDPPAEPRRMRIWSNGKLYPVLVEPGPVELRELRGRSTLVRTYGFRGYRVAGERYWNGGVELVLADDDSATPLEIFVLNKGVRVRLLLDEAASQFGLPEVRQAAGARRR